jgi:PilZ domain
MRLAELTAGILTTETSPITKVLSAYSLGGPFLATFGLDCEETVQQEVSEVSKIFEAVRRASQNRAPNVGTPTARLAEMDTPDRQGDLNASARPSDTMMTDPTNPSAQAPRIGHERRNQRRASLSLRVHLRYADPKNGGFDEVQQALNSCRSGLYFTTTKKRYNVGMRLRIVYPYHSAHDAIPASSEDHCEVVRVDHLPNGRFGIAVLLRRCSHLKHCFVGATTNSLVQETEERRASARNSFSAAAVIVDTQSGVRLQARCSDLSMAGCYVDTINPFPEKARVRLRLSVAQENFETGARVCFSHIGMGMGLSFYELTPEQNLLLVGWLNGGASEPFPIHEQPAISEEVDSPNGDLASRLIRMLRSKGLLTEAEVSVLLSKDLRGEDELVCRPCTDRL